MSNGDYNSYGPTLIFLVSFVDMLQYMSNGDNNSYGPTLLFWFHL